jgi:hypothetical protein
MKVITNCKSYHVDLVVIQLQAFFCNFLYSIGLGPMVYELFFFFFFGSLHLIMSIFRNVLQLYLTHSIVELPFLLTYT